MEPEILDSRDVAKRLLGDRCMPNSYKSIEKMARQGKIPGQKVLGVWRFHKDAIRDSLMRTQK